MAEISIIIPIYQAEKTLPRCIDSILSQTFSDFELLLIDDGSTDQSGTICDQYAQSDPRITVFHQTNAGVSAARNQGIDIATGKYIMFCDSDDYVSPLWCETLYDRTEANPDFLIVCNAIRVSSEGTFKKSIHTTPITTKSYFEFWKSHSSAYTVTKIYKRELLNRHHLRFRRDIQFAEDVAFNVEYFQLCTGAIILPDVLYFYCDTPSSLMHRKYEDFFPVYSFPFTVRLPLIDKDNLAEFCDFWLADFIGMFSYVFERKELNLLQKLRFNQKIVCDPCFQQCLNKASGVNEPKIVLKILKSKNYYFYWLLQEIVKYKNQLCSRNSS